MNSNRNEPDHADTTGVTNKLPPVVFGTSALGNLYEALTDERKLAITRAWFEHGEQPVIVDSAGKYGAGLALESIGANLRCLEVPADDVILSNKLGWYRVPLKGSEPTFEPGAWVDLEYDAEQRISRQGILDCWQQGCELLGEPYKPQMVSVHDPDEFLAAADSPSDRQQRKQHVLDAYESLFELKSSGQVASVGVGSKDWRIAKEMIESVSLDWVMIANSLTVYTHPSELLNWIDELANRGVSVINSAVFNGGFLVGGDFYNYRAVDPKSPADQIMLGWREKFFALCQQHGVKPAAACVEFGLSPQAISSVALSSSDPKRVANCATLARTKAPPAFWEEAKEQELIATDYPHLPA